MFAELSDHAKSLHAELESFMAEHVYPNENTLLAHADGAERRPSTAFGADFFTLDHDAGGVRVQVSAVSPSARSLTFSILAVGVRGSASTTRT